jgi:dCMP deaminase
MTPCRTCAMMIINAGIKRVVCAKRYHADVDTIEMFKQAAIELTIVNEEVEKYDKQ